MEDRKSLFRVLATLCMIQMLLISSASAQPAAAPGPAGAPLPSTPVTSVVSPPASPPTIYVTTQKFVPNATILQVGNSSSTGRITKTALTSSGGEYALALIMDGFGTETSYQYCWAEVHNSLGNLTFRENCRPPKVEKCSLTLTKGDLRLTLESRGAKLVSWHTDTEDKGVVDVKLSDTGIITLVGETDQVIWTSADDTSKCLDPYNPANKASSAVGFSKLVVVCTTILGLAASGVLF